MSVYFIYYLQTVITAAVEKLALDKKALNDALAAICWLKLFQKMEIYAYVIHCNTCAYLITILRNTWKMDEDYKSFSYL